MGYNPEIKYVWRAVYTDGTILNQFDESGKERAFKEIDQSRLLKFSWVPVDGQGREVSVTLRPGQRLIAFRRVKWRPFATDSKPEIYYAVGWQATVNGRNVKSISWILPDDSVVIAEDIDDYLNAQKKIVKEV